MHVQPPDAAAGFVDATAFNPHFNYSLRASADAFVPGVSGSGGRLLPQHVSSVGSGASQPLAAALGMLAPSPSPASAPSPAGPAHGEASGGVGPRLMVAATGGGRSPGIDSDIGGGGGPGSVGGSGTAGLVIGGLGMGMGGVHGAGGVASRHQAAFLHHGGGLVAPLGSAAASAVAAAGAGGRDGGLPLGAALGPAGSDGSSGISMPPAGAADEDDGGADANLHQLVTSLLE